MKRTFISLFTFICCNLSYSQEWEQFLVENNVSFTSKSISFGSPDVAYGGYSYFNTGNDDSTRIYKSTNKGLNWFRISSFYGAEQGGNGPRLSFINKDTGWVEISVDFPAQNANCKIYRTFSGGNNWQVVSQPNYNYQQTVKLLFLNLNLGYRLEKENDGFYIYKTTNGGVNWQSIWGPSHSSWRITDMEISAQGIVYIGGYVSPSDRTYFAKIDNGTYTEIYSHSIIPPISIDRIHDLETITENNIDYVYLFGNTNLLKYSSGSLSLLYQFTSAYDSRQILFKDSNVGFIKYGTASPFQTHYAITTNGGSNWTIENSFSNVSTTLLFRFNDIICGSAGISQIAIRKLSTNLASFVDLISSSGSMTVNGETYSTSGADYIRGGLTSLDCSSINNSGQSNERIFYKWNDGYMYSSHITGGSYGNDFYFDLSGTTIANHYKTKQLSTVSSSISNPSQSKSIRDTTVNGITTTHTIHESMGGIFYSKSTNYGATYQTEEAVNLSENPSASIGNKNAALCVIRNIGAAASVTPNDANRNVAVVWERYNNSTGCIELKLAHRVLNQTQNGYEWLNVGFGGRNFIDSFPASANFESKTPVFCCCSSR